MENPAHWPTQIQTLLTTPMPGPVRLLQLLLPVPGGHRIWRLLMWLRFRHRALAFRLLHAVTVMAPVPVAIWAIHRRADLYEAANDDQRQLLYLAREL